MNTSTKSLQLLSLLIADFCNKICQLQTFRAPFESSQCIRQISPPGTLNR
jgi:hypothetical protein